MSEHVTRDSPLRDRIKLLVKVNKRLVDCLTMEIRGQRNALTFGRAQVPTDAFYRIWTAALNTNQLFDERDISGVPGISVLWKLPFAVCTAQGVWWNDFNQNNAILDKAGKETGFRFRDLPTTLLTVPWEVDDAGRAMEVLRKEFGITDAEMAILSGAQCGSGSDYETLPSGDSPAVDGASKPDDTGYVARPADPTAYVPVSDIMARETPDALNLTEKQARGLIKDFAKNNIRWTRPLKKDGTPRPNRRSVHLADWRAFVKRCEKGPTAGSDWHNPPEDEIASRTAAIRRSKAAGQ
ncbi:MAG: hypothetical protein HOP29_10935 [Phycisphaerales bacterium]|nr:hypothetical protein [Phycisphaerales bacterium]